MKHIAQVITFLVFGT